MTQEPLLIIGAGAAGLMAAISAAYSGVAPLILERNERPGRKLLITGKGRCNVTNDCTVSELIAHIPVNGRFLYSAFSHLNSSDTVRLLENAGLPLKTERGNRVFPVSDRAADVVDTLVEQCKMLGCRFHQARAAELLTENGRVVGIRTEADELIYALHILICTGGMSYPATGSTGDGYRLARSVGHTVVPVKPSLVPMTSPDKDCRDMMGLSLRNIAIKVTDNVKKSVIYEDFGEMLFTHFGLSGPVILSASSHIRKPEPNRYTVHIDLKPALSEEQLDARLLRDFSQNVNRDFGNSLAALLPRKMIPVIVRRCGIPATEKVNQITREQRRTLLQLLKDFPVEIDGFRPVDEAIVTSGGIDVREVNPKTMESKKIQGLYFAGEVLDVDAYTGGFNLQIAWSTGWLAGQSAAQAWLEQAE